MVTPAFASSGYCLMHMAGIAKKEKMPIQFIHVVQILAAGL